MELKPYPSYRQTDLPWLGQIPTHWEAKPLKHAVSLNPDVLNETTDPNYEIQYLDIGNVDEIEGIGNIQEFRFENAPSRARRRVRAGDTIISTVRTYLKAVAYFENPPENQIVSTGFAVLRPKQTIHPKFLSWLIQSKPFVEKVVVHSVGVGYPAINPSELASLKVWFPSLPEQQAIAAYLDRQTAKIDALIARKERLLDLLTEQRAAIISQTVTKGLNPNVKMKESGAAWLGPVPSHWEVKRIKTLTPFVTSGSRWWAQYYSDEGALFMRIGNISKKTVDIDLEDVQFVTPPKGAEMERTRVRGGDVLISITANIGSVGVVPENINEAYVNQHIALTRPLKEKVNPKWMAYVLLSSFGEAQFQSLLYGGTKDGLGLDDVQNLIIPLPALYEQNDLVTYLDYQNKRLTDLAAKIETAIERLREYRAALISSVVTGKVKVT
jgi:type I restriction enzyme S subunit